MAEQEQWVNLPKEDLFKSDGVTSKARLGMPYVSFKTKETDLTGFKLKITVTGDYAKYTAEEKKRNRNFRLFEEFKAQAMNAGTDKGLLYQYVRLAAAGGNQYQLKAKYKDQEVSGTIKLITRRRLFFQVMAMRTVTAPDLTNLIDTFWGESDKLFIDLQRVGGTDTVPKIPCMEDTKGRQLIDSCRPKYTLKKYKPYAFAICFIEHYADFAESTYRWTISRTIPKVLSSGDFNGLEFTLKLPANTYLWKDLDPQDDANERWAGGGPLIRVVDSTGKVLSTIDKIESWRTARNGVAAATHGGMWNQIVVKLPSDAIRRKLLSDQTVQLRIDWKLGLADGFTNGVSYNSTNLVAVCRRARWEDRPVDKMAQTIIHEVGHKIGLVPKGGAMALDAHAQQYTQRTHTGSHCGEGASWDGTAWSGSPTCVMFGSSWSTRTGAFCALCAPQVRKLDLSGDTLKVAGFKDSL